MQPIRPIQFTSLFSAVAYALANGEVGNQLNAPFEVRAMQGEAADEVIAEIQDAHADPHILAGELTTHAIDDEGYQMVYQVASEEAHFAYVWVWGNSNTGDVIRAYVL